MLDLPVSSRGILPSADRSVLDLTREATALLAWSIAGLGDPFAIYGFASNGRRHSARRRVPVRATPAYKLRLLTDGEPADVDEHDPLYLRFDARKAVEDLDRRAIHTYCPTLDPTADDYVVRIFGRNRYTVLDRVQQLTERLPALFLNLTR